ncbi:hypothetical protein [Murinocardiopsis flavida]|nr:hypothetical protein [Murinocardiopsis flavida]
MKRIKLAVPASREFAAISDLDGTFTEVADPKGQYRFKRGGRSFEFEATGESVEHDGATVQVFAAVAVND